MPPSIFRTPDFSNQFPFPLEVQKIGILLYTSNLRCFAERIVLGGVKGLIIPISFLSGSTSSSSSFFFFVGH